MNLSREYREAVRKLRHKEKLCHAKNYIKKREKISVTRIIHERPTAVNNRSVAGKVGKTCLVTLTDHKTRCLLAE